MTVKDLEYLLTEHGAAHVSIDCIDFGHVKCVVVLKEGYKIEDLQELVSNKKPLGITIDLIEQRKEGE